MKKNLLLMVAFSICSILATAQNNIQLTINHKLGDADFQMNAPAKNNLNHDFKTDRLEYYISEISIVHDGSNETLIEELWALVNAAENTTIDLGDYPITEVEGIKFHIGVDPDHNHLDPTTYPSTHPLAPQAPSMHWGWASGYRFIAFEGEAGSDLNQLVELHGLGDNNYFTTEISVSATATNGAIDVELDADYARGLENISVNNGVIVHGENDEARTILENFRDFVFSQVSVINDATEISNLESFEVYPTLVDENQLIVKLSALDAQSAYQISITDIVGQQIKMFSSIQNGQNLNLENFSNGMYIVNLIKEGQPILARKIILR